MKEIEGNILDIDYGIIAHQCNCKGVMGSGLAKQIREKYPVVYHKYQAMCTEGLFILGKIQLVNLGDSLYICNMAGQDNYGREEGRVYTNYDALAVCLSKLSIAASQRGLPVYLPYKLGCGSGGGDWGIVLQIIESVCPSATIVCLKKEAH